MLKSDAFDNSLPKEWEVVELEGICEILDRQRIPINVAERNERISGKDESQLFPYYGATGQVGWIDDYIFDGEYVLLGEDGAPFLETFKDKAYMVNGRFWVNNHAHILKSLGSNKYLCHYLNRIDYRSFVTGTTRLKLNQASMKQIPVCFPSIPEQHQIVNKIEELFSELDNGIENLKKAREQLKTYRQAVLKYAFEGKLTEEWRNRQIQAGNPPEPAEKLLERIKIEREKHYQKQLADWKKECEQAKKEGKKKPAKPKKPKELSPLTKEEIAELPKLPKGWGWKRIFQIGGVQLGRQRSPKNKSNLYPTPYIRAANITEDGLQLNSVLEMEFKPNEKKIFSLKKGDLVIAEASGSAEQVGKSALWNEEIKNCCFQNTVIRLRPFLTNSKYILHVLKFYYVIGYFSKVAGGVGINHIGANNFSFMRFPLCSDFEQTQIVSKIESRLSVCDKLEQIIEDSLQKSEALRQSILKKAFSGELTKDWREKHPELVSGENSAEKLLERIKAEKEKLKTAAKPRRKPARKRRS